MGTIDPARSEMGRGQSNPLTLTFVTPIGDQNPLKLTRARSPTRDQDKGSSVNEVSTASCAARENGLGFEFHTDLIPTKAAPGYQLVLAPFKQVPHNTCEVQKNRVTHES